MSATAPVEHDAPAWRPPRWLPLVLAAGILALSFAFVDPAVFRWARGAGEPVTAFFRAITDFGRASWILWPLAAVIAVTGVVFRRETGRKMAAVYQYCLGVMSYIFVSVAFTGLAADLVKFLAGRARPELFDAGGSLNFAPLSLRPVYQSFPSGHATTVFALATGIALLAPRARLPLAAFAVLVAASRVMIEKHYFTDIVAGSMMGIWGAYAVRKWFTARGIVFAARADGRMGLKGRRLRRWLWRRVRGRL